jgi:hypothetical protein
MSAKHHETIPASTKRESFKPEGKPPGNTNTRRFLPFFKADVFYSPSGAGMAATIEAQTGSTCGSNERNRAARLAVAS